jgi:hypothetical protein
LLKQLRFPVEESSLKANTRAPTSPRGCACENRALQVGKVIALSARSDRGGGKLPAATVAVVILSSGISGGGCSIRSFRSRRWNTPGGHRRGRFFPSWQAQERSSSPSSIRSRRWNTPGGHRRGRFFGGTVCSWPAVPLVPRPNVPGPGLERARFASEARRWRAISWTGHPQGRRTATGGGAYVPMQTRPPPRRKLGLVSCARARACRMKHGPG